MLDSDAPTLGPNSLPDLRASAVATPSPFDVSAGEAPIPSVVGRYRILQLLGEGGMGAVYEAEQDSPRRTVALKVIRAGYADLEMLRRFDTETQALGRLQHPGIAQIYDAGTAETPYGRQPYIAMELVRGKTLLAWCDEHRLTVRQRLELMAKICEPNQRIELVRLLGKHWCTSAAHLQPALRAAFWATHQPELLLGAHHRG